MAQPPPRSTLFSYTTLFRSSTQAGPHAATGCPSGRTSRPRPSATARASTWSPRPGPPPTTRPSGRAPGSDASSSDRKSTRLNSSHMSISYAVFCLKKKKRKTCNSDLFINGATTTEIYPLFLHDALPIFNPSRPTCGDWVPIGQDLTSPSFGNRAGEYVVATTRAPSDDKTLWAGTRIGRVFVRSEEHTSELQSHVNLVCRLLLEKKKTQDVQLRSFY